MGWFFVSRILAAGLTLIALLVLTRVLDPEGFGTYNIIMLGATAAFSIAFAWIPAVVHRFHSVAEFKGRATGWVLGAGLAFMAVAGVAALVLALLGPADWRGIALLGLFYCLAHALNEVGLSGLRVYHKGLPFALTVVLRQAVGVGLALGFVHLGFGYAGAVAGMAAGAFATGLYALGRTLDLSGIGLPHRPALAQFLAFGVPLALVSSNAMIVLLISQAILAARVDLAAVGTFAAAQTLALRTISLPVMTLTQTTAASIFRAHEEGGDHASDAQLDRQFSFLMLIVLPIVLPLILSGQTVAELLFNARFSGEVARHLPILALAAFLSGLQGAYFAYSFLIARKTAMQFLIMAAGVVVHAALTVLAVRWFGALGASLAVLGSAVVSLAAYVAIGQKVRAHRFSWPEIRKAGLAALVLAAFCLGAEAAGGPLLALPLLAAGFVAFLLALYYQRQMAAVAVFRRIGLRRGPAGR